MDAAEEAFGTDVEHSQLAKLQGDAPESLQGRSSPSECTGAVEDADPDKPERKHISTSFVERHNPTVQMQIRRFTRLTNALSRRFENHAHMVALYTVWYNFVKLHKKHRMSLSMAAGVSGRLWSMEDVVALVEAAEPALGKRGRINRGCDDACI